MKLETIAERAVFARTAAGLSKAQVCSLISLRSSWLDLFEKGETSAAPDIVRQFATLYGVGLDWLMFGIGRNLEEQEEELIKRLKSAHDKEHLRALLESMPMISKEKKAPEPKLTPILSGES